MKKIKGINKLLLSGILLLGIITNLSARDSYVGLKLSNLDFDNTVLANESGYENIGPYTRYNDVSLIGIQMQRFYYNQSSPFLWGGEVNLMLNNGNFFKGGMLDFDFKIGGHIDAFKVYGILGAGLQSLSEYTAATGMYFGIGANYDINNNFGITTNYTKYNMTTFTNNGEYDLSDDQNYKLSGFSLGILYKY